MRTHHYVAHGHIQRQQVVIQGRSLKTDSSRPCLFHNFAQHIPSRRGQLEHHEPNYDQEKNGSENNADDPRYTATLQLPLPQLRRECPLVRKSLLSIRCELLQRVGRPRSRKQLWSGPLIKVRHLGLASGHESASPDLSCPDRNATSVLATLVFSSELLTNTD